MKKLVLIIAMLFGVVASSYNASKPKKKEQNSVDINYSLDRFVASLDSLNTVLDEIR
ncbi:MAG: hypothetical protein ACTJHT_14140 [Sphingobacterium sp.]